MDWFSQDDTIKGKFLMVTELWGSFECCFIVIVLAVNRYTAVMCPVRYRTMWTTKKTNLIFLMIWVFIVVTHMPVVLYADFFSGIDCYDTTNLYYFYSSATNYWNNYYGYADLILTAVTLIPSLILYTITGRFILKNLQQFASNEKKMIVLKLTIISFFVCLG
uniref:Serpentine receptor class gamma n=1 Tax=Acrobeloides nanus TaxID=290746 RepID=A0A914E4F9_9BILA